MLRKISLLAFISLATHAFLYGQTLLDKEIHLDKFKGTVGAFLTELSTEGAFTFAYSNQIDIGRELTIGNGRKPIRAWLDEIFGERKVEYVVNQNKIILLLITNKTRPGTNSTVIIRGHVKDSVSGEVLIGATVYVKDLSIGVSSNAYGFFSLAAPKGTHKVNTSFVGYKTQSLELDFSEDQVLNIHLSPASYQLREVSITADDRDVSITSPELGVHTLSAAVIDKIPALAGEVDILRALQLLPGVKNSGEASSNISVRGGNLDQNLILLDEAPVYNPSHAIGVFSIFNIDAIKDVQLYKNK